MPKTRPIKPLARLLVVLLAGHTVLSAASPLDGYSIVKEHSRVFSEPLTADKQALALGNGRISGMLWMPDNRIRFQLSHSDYWRTGSFTEHPRSGYGGWPVPLGRVNLIRSGGFVSPGDRVTGQLSLAEGCSTIQVDRPAGGQSKVEVFCDMESDCLVVHWKEHAGSTASAVLEIEGWRDSVSTEVAGQFGVFKESPASVRMPDETEYLKELIGPASRDIQCGQSTLCGVSGATARVEAAGRSLRFVVENGSEFDLTFYVASSLGNDMARNRSNSSITLQAAMDSGFERLNQRHRAWWKEFWEKSYVKISSSDPFANKVEDIWFQLSYLMASSNRGIRPVKFNGGNWLMGTNDVRDWGGGYWHYDSRDMMLAMMPANHPELAGNFFQMYLNASELLKKQTAHIFRHEGMWIPETVSFDGAMYLADRKPLYTGKTQWVQLIFSTGLEVAINLHQFARYTGDEELLRGRVYPFMKEVVRFFRLHMSKEADGLYHIYPANAHETYWRVKDDICDLAGLRAVLPLLIQSSERYGLDAEERAAWREFLEHLAPLPRGREILTGKPGWRQRPDKTYGCNCFVALDQTADMYASGRIMEDNELHNWHPMSIFGIYPFQITHIDSLDRQTGVNTFRSNVHSYMRDSWARDVAVPAILGLGDEAREQMTNYVAKEFSDGVYLPGGSSSAAVRMEQSGKVATSLNAMLLQQHDRVIRLFPASPSGWDMSFKLLAPGPFEIEASRAGSLVSEVSVRSRCRGKIEIINPWPGKKVDVVRGGSIVASVTGDRLSWDCDIDSVYSLRQAE